MYMILLILFENQEGDTDRRQLFPSLISSPKFLQQLGLGQSKARGPELNPDLPVKAGTQHLSYHLMPPREQVSRKLGLETEL